MVLEEEEEDEEEECKGIKRTKSVRVRTEREELRGTKVWGITKILVGCGRPRGRPRELACGGPDATGGLPTLPPLPSPPPTTGCRCPRRVCLSSPSSLV